MANSLAKHGSEGGYQAELQTKNICNRCRAAHREYNRQYTKAGKARGLKYPRNQVIDHLAAPPRPGVPRGGKRVAMGETHADPKPLLPGPQSEPETGKGTPGAPVGPSLSDRIRGLWVPGSDGGHDDYVSEDDPPDYLHSIEPDPEPMGGESDWSTVTDEEFVINAAGMKQIEDNLGFYLSVVGITIEMIDPYCGPILAKNFDNIVKRWSAVIAHYPPAARLFLDTKGGILFGWIGAIQATWPVLYALYEHHLAKTVRVHDGVIERKTDGPGPFRGFDSTTPPMADKFEYTVS